MKPTADQLRAYRTRHGLSQQQLADVLGKTARRIKYAEADPDQPLAENDWRLLRLMEGSLTPAQARAEVGHPTPRRSR